MITPESSAALDHLQGMDKDIQHAEANLRILKAMNSSAAPELNGQLEAMKRQRANMMAAIHAEHQGG